MHNLINAVPLYNFLKYCNNSSLEKVILDCGAGGANPPLSLFHEFGYKTYGIELCDEQIEKANSFSSSRDIDLNIIKGNMTRIPYENEIFSFVYSYNTTVHMKKDDFFQALLEFNRVLKHDGLCYINFLTKECDTYGEGLDMGNGVYMQMEEDEKIIYSHYEEKEIEEKFNDFEILYKEKRIIQRKINGREYVSAYLDYILKKI